MKISIPNVKDLKFLAKGKRAVVYKGFLNGIPVVVKKEKPDIKAKGRIKNEARWLKILNKYQIGPRLYFSGKDYVVCQFIEGDTILRWIPKSKKSEIKKIIIEVLEQCRILDQLGINKKELHRPLKHIIIKKHPVMIDFERTYRTKRPKNVTQFCQFIFSISNILKEKGIKIDKEKLKKLLINYKKRMREKDFIKIISFFKKI